MSLRGLQLALLVCAAAALIIMLGLFGTEVRLACLGAIVGTAALSAPERRRPGGGWWVLLGAGAALSVTGLGLSELAEAPGGIVAIAASALVVSACAIGFPLGSSGESRGDSPG